MTLAGSCTVAAAAHAEDPAAADRAPQWNEVLSTGSADPAGALQSPGGHGCGRVVLAGAVIPEAAITMLKRLNEQLGYAQEQSHA